jgi:hypothetical protein
VTFDEAVLLSQTVTTTADGKSSPLNIDTVNAFELSVSFLCAQQDFL